ncbi:MAG TPA: phosphate signaling complex protein PhoU [Bacteroidales bacterium]|nr:phosphate signaling complex protein PhoU [Bacteroidales bacterium]HRZ49226.1 phosphate signaling complex protein PhoU [Bacteroidales bacterium]
MNHLTYEIDYLKESFVEILELVKSQLSKSIEALALNNMELAEEVIRNEKRVDALELSLEKSCENIIALFQPVATDLRFVLAIFKSVSDLERIGDHSKFIARLVKDREEQPLKKADLEDYKVAHLFSLVNAIYSDLIGSFESADTHLARATFHKDKEINKLYHKLVSEMKSRMSADKGNPADALDIYSIITRLERSSNLLTNIAEEIIFYLDAEILKHDKKKKKQTHLNPTGDNHPEE